MTLDAPPPPASTMRRDLISAYAASGMKVLSWAVAAALIFRFDVRYFATFALIRATLSLLNYSTLGLAPAIIRRLNLTASERVSAVPEAGIAESATESSGGSPVLSYADPRLLKTGEDPQLSVKRVVFSALLLAILIGVIGGVAAGVMANNVRFAEIAALQSSARDLTLLLGIGLALRLASDVCGAILQAFGFIAADNVALVVGDVVWIVTMILGAVNHPNQNFMASEVAWLFLISSILLLVLRIVFVTGYIGPWLFRPQYISLRIVGQLLGFGLLVSLAQLADFLYAPTDYWIIRTLLSLDQITVYAPAVQIDGALLLLVGGLASVVLPKAAAAHVRGNLTALREYYLKGTLASLAMLTAAGLVVWLASAWIFRLWLGDPMPATVAILPLVLVHTVVGGSSAVGRSVLLGMGKVKPFTAAVLVAGVANVILSYCFVRFLGLGLKGIVLGTIIAVVARCAIWQPWYVWRCLRRA